MGWWDTVTDIAQGIGGLVSLFDDGPEPPRPNPHTATYNWLQQRVNAAESVRQLGWQAWMQGQQADLYGQMAGVQGQVADHTRDLGAHRTAGADLYDRYAGVLDAQQDIFSRRAGVQDQMIDLHSRRGANLVGRSHLEMDRAAIASGRAELATAQGGVFRQRAGIAGMRAGIGEQRAGLALGRAGLTTTRAGLTAAQADLAARTGAATQGQGLVTGREAAHQRLMAGAQGGRAALLAARADVTQGIAIRTGARRVGAADAVLARTMAFAAGDVRQAEAETKVAQATADVTATKANAAIGRAMDKLNQEKGALAVAEGQSGLRATSYRRQAGARLQRDTQREVGIQTRTIAAARTRAEAAEEREAVTRDRAGAVVSFAVGEHARSLGATRDWLSSQEMAVNDLRQQAMDWGLRAAGTEIGADARALEGLQTTLRGEGQVLAAQGLQIQSQGEHLDAAGHTIAAEAHLVDAAGNRVDANEHVLRSIGSDLTAREFEVAAETHLNRADALLNDAMAQWIQGQAAGIEGDALRLQGTRTGIDADRQRHDAEGQRLAGRGLTLDADGRVVQAGFTQLQGTGAQLQANFFSTAAAIGQYFLGIQPDITEYGGDESILGEMMAWQPPTPITPTPLPQGGPQMNVGSTGHGRRVTGTRATGPARRIEGTGGQATQLGRAT